MCQLDFEDETFQGHRMSFELRSSERVGRRPGPVVVVVMDGVGVGRADEGNAVHLARTPTLDRLRDRYPYRVLRAHGTAVGLPSDDDMGNSEVGHNALGAGRIFAQGARLVNEAIADERIFRGTTWTSLVERVVERTAALHFIGLLSDGNVHSHIEHLKAMISNAHQRGVQSIFVHALLDGRDVGETSALTYVDDLTAFLDRFEGTEGRRYRIASGGGRMVITMDRYEADWSMVERGWKTHVHGEGRRFSSCREAIETLRAETPGVTDQNLPPFVIGDAEGPVGPIRDGDAVVFFNFRGDRAIEISKAFEQDDFRPFDRGQRPDVFYAGMMQYDGDEKIPNEFLVDPPAIDRTLGEYLARNGVTQFACSETQKFGHVTYFWNGNRSGMFDEKLEKYVEVPSDLGAFEWRPWMKAYEITEATIDAIASGQFRFMRINYANGDMVGHTGELEATIIGVQTVDLMLARLVAAVQKANGVVLITADHGNADEMFMWDAKRQAYQQKSDGSLQPKTSHTLNPVPLFVVGEGLTLRPDLADAGIANLPATCLELLGYTPPLDFEPSLLA